MNLQKGFLFNGNAEDDQGKLLLTFYGIGPTGPFVLQFTNEKALFFILREQKNLPFSNKILFERKNISLSSFGNESVDALYFPSLKMAMEARRILEENKIKIFEADVAHEERFLMERFIQTSIEFAGNSVEKNGLLYYTNPQIKKGFYYPTPSLFSFDIETGMNGDLYSIAYDFKSSDSLPQTKNLQYIMMVGPKHLSEKNLQFFDNEKELILCFLDHFFKIDPDIIIGWHVIGFDLLFLKNKCEKLGIDFPLGRGKKNIQIIERKGIGYFAEIAGRIVVDGPLSLKNAFYKFKNFKLDTVAQTLLGKNKEITGNVNKVEEIEYRFKNDKKALAKYNLQDAILVSEIFEKTKIVDHYLKRSLLTGLFFNNLNMPTKAFDFYFLPRLHRKGYLAPNYSDLQRNFTSNSGGTVLEPTPGLYEHILVFDFISLYPSIIETFKIDPLSRFLSKNNPLKTPIDMEFSRDENILPSYITELKSRRDQLKDKDPEFAKAIKILMNSFYGVMGSSNSRFYHADIPRAITEIGRWYLQRLIDFIKDKGIDIIYGDTDSLFVKPKASDRFELEEKAIQICKEFNNLLKNDLKRFYKVENSVQLRLDRHFIKLFIPPNRLLEAGAKKKYVGLIQNKDKQELYFSGMEMVRSDWTEMAHNFQYQLYQKTFDQIAIEGWIKEFINRLKTGEFDDQLNYTKKLTKESGEYVKTIPVHVKAAMMLPNQGRDLREISYFITRRGPIPEQLPHNDIDYEHYINKQMAPIADALLSTMGKKFDDLIGGDQLSLFEL